MPKINKKPVRCIACNDTGKNSRGGACIPCQKRQEAEALATSQRLYPRIQTPSIKPVPVRPLTFGTLFE